jgi:hypothetical protein
LKKFDIIIIATAFLASGCKNYIPYLYIDNLIEMSRIYCNENEFLQCERYQACISKQYNKVKSKSPLLLSRAPSIISRNALSIGEVNSHINLISDSYSLLDLKKPDLNDLGLSVSVSYFIYAHNACANITGDKTYNIDNYMPLLKKELGVK